MLRRTVNQSSHQELCAIIVQIRMFRFACELPGRKTVGVQVQARGFPNMYAARLGVYSRAFNLDEAEAESNAAHSQTLDRITVVLYSEKSGELELSEFRVSTLYTKKQLITAGRCCRFAAKMTGIL